MKLADKFKLTDAERDQRMAFLHLTRADFQLLAALRPDIEKRMPAIVAEFYVDLLKHSEPRRQFADAKKLSPDEPEVYEREGKALLQAGRRDEAVGSLHGLPVAVTRFANIYGGGDLNFSRLIPEAIVAVLEGRRPVIRSDGSPQRDFLHVDDAVAAYLAIEHEVGAGGPAAGEAFNAGGERPHSVAEVLELIGEVSGREVEPEYHGTGNPAGEIDRQYVDSAKLWRLTGWRPRVELRDGLRRTLEWYRDRPEARP